MPSFRQLTFVVLYSGYFLVMGPLSLWLLLNTQTAVGLLLATFGLLSLLLPLSFIIRQRAQNKWLRRAPEYVVVLLVVVGTAVFLQAPSGNPGPDAPVQHRFVGGGRYGRFSLTNLVPESEQVNLGFTVMPYVDPLLTVEQSRRVSVFTMYIYREMEQDPNFRELGSAMNLAYDELWGRPFNTGHYYLYVPPNAGSRPAARYRLPARQRRQLQSVYLDLVQTGRGRRLYPHCPQLRLWQLG